MLASVTEEEVPVHEPYVPSDPQVVTPVPPGASMETIMAALSPEPPDSPGAAVIGDPQLLKEAASCQGQGHHDPDEEMKGHQVQGETGHLLETPLDMETGLGILQGGILQLLDAIIDVPHARRSVLEDLYRGELWRSHCPWEWKNPRDGYIRWVDRSGRPHRKH
ncbi:hypothetical protein A2U01_0036475 [Trifolium medium]|uniref:Uncharacterized protein n=1 Tax=Trifolium medium TaxID=97028 RepID=A0A392PUK0_9FABA|nr:hypothetical protein [Trifolium medium]